MRAAVLDGVDAVALAEEGQRAPFDLDDAAAAVRQLGQLGGADQTLSGDGHGALLPN